jgi:hypothetical protein
MAENICISGGAQGADSMFALCADRVGHKVKHFGFPKHGYRSKIGEHIDVVSGNYKKWDEHLKTANTWLERDLRNLSDYSRNLLRRNMAITFEAETALYAVTNLVDDKVTGGTAWAVTRANQMMMPVYLFNQLDSKWYHNEMNYIGLQFPIMPEGMLPPMPEGIYGAVGSRELTENGINAIFDLYKLDR